MSKAQQAPTRRGGGGRWLLGLVTFGAGVLVGYFLFHSAEPAGPTASPHGGMSGTSGMGGMGGMGGSEDSGTPALPPGHPPLGDMMKARGGNMPPVDEGPTKAGKGEDGRSAMPPGHPKLPDDAGPSSEGAKAPREKKASGR